MSHRLKKNHIITKWSGGETTELFIFPEDAQYKEGNYQFRLSTATVEVEESVFTSLPDVDRTLMVLEGKMELIHLNQHSSLLGPLDVDQFKGSWVTESKGQCVDFNLMCKGGTEGEVKGYNLSQGENLMLDLSGRMNFTFVYQGMIELKGERINKGELFIANSPSSDMSILALTPSILVLVNIIGA